MPKKAREVLNKKERKNLRFLSSFDDHTLLNAVIVRLNNAQFLNTKLKSFVIGLCENELLQEILAHHHNRFSSLYVECKKEADSFVQFQFQ